MYSLKTAATVCLVAGLLVTPLVAQKIRVSTHTVPIYATVVDRDRRLVADLLREDFEVYDNGKIQAITSFSNQPTPITAVVMLDTSGSMTLNMDFVKLAAEQFVLRLLPQDKAKVGAFNDKIQILPEHADFTGDRDLLIRLLRHNLDFGYPTRLYDAVDQSIAALRIIEGRRVVLVFTDGDDTSSKVNMGDALERARLEDVMVYAIGLQSEFFNGQQRQRTRPDRGLKKLAEETGGGYFELERKDELGETFTRVAQELHSQYVLGFSPETFDGRVHKVEVKVKRPGMNVRGRKSYVAVPPEPTEKGSLNF